MKKISVRLCRLLSRKKRGDGQGGGKEGVLFWQKKCKTNMKTSWQTTRQKNDEIGDDAFLEVLWPVSRHFIGRKKIYRHKRHE